MIGPLQRESPPAGGLRWAQESHRMVLICGAVEVGAVFPPGHRLRGVWRWRLWLGGIAITACDGLARGEAEAKAALLERFEALIADLGLPVPALAAERDEEDGA